MLGPEDLSVAALLRRATSERLTIERRVAAVITLGRRGEEGAHSALVELATTRSLPEEVLAATGTALGVHCRVEGCFVDARTFLGFAPAAQVALSYALVARTQSTSDGDGDSAPGDP